MDTPVYPVTIVIGGSGQNTESKIGSVLPESIVTRQSGSIVLTATDPDGDPFDLSSLNGLEVYAKPYDSADVEVNLGTGVVSGAGNNIFTITWVRDTLSAGWSQFAYDKDGVVVIYIEMEETGTADYFQWSTRVNVTDGSYTGSASILPLGVIYYYNLTYTYDNTTTDADPTAGYFRLNNTTLASATEMYINDYTQSNVDLQTYWQGLSVGSHVYIGNPNVKLESGYFTVSGTPTNNTDYTTVPLTYVSAGTSQFTNGSQFAFTADTASSGASSFGMNYEYSTTITDADPTAGKFRLNNATLASATFMYVADDDNGGLNNSAYLQGFGTGDFIRFSSLDDKTKVASYTVNGTPTNATGYTKIPLTYVDNGATAFVDADECNFFLDRDQDTTDDIKSVFRFEFDTATTATDPTSGKIKFDNATPASVTNLYISGDNNNGGDISSILEDIVSGDDIYLEADDDSGDYLVCTASGDITDNTGWFTLPVTIDDSGTLPASGAILSFYMKTAGGGGGGGGILPSATTTIDQTDSPYAITASDISDGDLIEIDSTSTADVDVTLDPALLAFGSKVNLINRSTYKGTLEVDDTGTDTINDTVTDFIFWKGDGMLTVVGDTTTNFDIGAGG